MGDNDTGSTLDFAADELFKRLDAEDTERLSEEDELKKKRPAPKETNEAEETSEETPEDDEAEEETEDDEDTEETEDEGDTEEEPKASKKVILEPDADAYVKHKVDGKEIEIKVSDLTRLYGQEAALTRKSQEAAELRKEAEARTLKVATAHTEMLARAEARWLPYSKINWIALTKDPNVSQEEVTALHAEAQKAYDDVQYHTTTLDSTIKEVQQARHNELVKRGQEAWRVLSNPETGIKGWNEKLYSDITSFASKNGLAPEILKELVDPSAFKLLHMAMLYEKGKQAVNSTKKINKTPKRIIKESAEPATRAAKSNKLTTAEQRLHKSGSLDDATEVLMRRMGLKDED